MDIWKLTDLAHAYNDLGWAVQEQLARVLEGATRDDGEDVSYGVNSNAARLIAGWAAQAQSAGVKDADLLYERASELAGM